MFDELLNGSTTVVAKSSAVSAADASNQCQQPTTPLNTHTTPEPTCHTPPITTSVKSSETINQAEPHADSSNMHTFYQRYPSEQRWTKDHPLEQVIGNPSQSIRNRRQLESDAEMCMFALTGSVHFSALSLHIEEKYSMPSEDGNPARANVKHALGRPYALSWKPCQGDSLNLPDHSEVEFINHMLILKLSKSNIDSSIEEIVSPMIVEVKQECNTFEHGGQKYKLI
nr:integrase, catalytic region, zinc finger, CCHC-type, peptidase aspartic, catalytic [Tanacetum cinerariifolium]